MKFCYLKTNEHSDIHDYLISLEKESHDSSYGFFHKMSELSSNNHMDEYIKNNILNSIYENYRLLWSVKKCFFSWHQHILNRRIPSNEWDFCQKSSFSDYSDDDKIIIHYKNGSWWFAVNEIIELWKQNLFGQDRFGFPTPYPLKNPYTGTNFTEGQMIYIYDKIRTYFHSRQKDMPLVIQLLKDCEFDLDMFTNIHHTWLRIYKVKEYVQDMSSVEYEDLLIYILRCLNVQQLFCKTCVLFSCYRHLFEPIIISFELHKIRFQVSNFNHYHHPHMQKLKCICTNIVKQYPEMGFHSNDDTNPDRNHSSRFPSSLDMSVRRNRRIFRLQSRIQSERALDGLQFIFQG